MLLAFKLCTFLIYFGYEPLLDMRIANIFSISYFSFHFIDGSSADTFEFDVSHLFCFPFTSFALELHPNFFKTDVQEYMASFYGFSSLIQGFNPLS